MRHVANWIAPGLLLVALLAGCSTGRKVHVAAHPCAATVGHQFFLDEVWRPNLKLTFRNACPLPVKVALASGDLCGFPIHLEPDPMAALALLDIMHIGCHFAGASSMTLRSGRENSLLFPIWEMYEHSRFFLATGPITITFDATYRPAEKRLESALDAWTEKNSIHIDPDPRFTTGRKVLLSFGRYPEATYVGVRYDRLKSCQGCDLELVVIKYECRTGKEVDRFVSPISTEVLFRVRHDGLCTYALVEEVDKKTATREIVALATYYTWPRE